MYLDTNLMALAIIPGALLLFYVYKKDKVEKEPLGLIFKLIFFGILSCFVAAFVEQVESQFLPKYPEGSLGNALVTSFLMAALVEETVKYLATRLGSWKYIGFNYRFDGIVYATSAAVGFAIYENIMYVSMYGFQTAIVRAFTAIPLHAFCGVFMGVFYSYSKNASLHGQPTGKWTALALLVPMGIHGVYDTFAFLGEVGTLPLLVFVVILDVAAIVTINKMSREDYRSGFYAPGTDPVFNGAAQPAQPQAAAKPKLFGRKAQQQPVQPQQYVQPQQPAQPQAQPQYVQPQQPVQPQVQPQYQQPVQPAQQQADDNDKYVEFE